MASKLNELAFELDVSNDVKMLSIGLDVSLNLGAVRVL